MIFSSVLMIIFYLLYYFYSNVLQMKEFVFRVSCYCIFSIEHSHFPCVCILRSVLDKSCIFLTMEIQPALDNFYISDPQKYLLLQKFLDGHYIV